ncbi:MAG: hypothetical protein EXS43_11185 [Opitutus sp.]|nr:hypothetical protein [Opitutus sp.]
MCRGDARSAGAARGGEGARFALRDCRRRSRHRAGRFHPAEADSRQPAGECGEIHRSRRGGIDGARRLPRDGRVELTFGVRDTGIGIPPEGLKRLFQSFSQVDASTTRRFAGTGLGLIISKRLAEMMEGDMRVASEVGRGSTFSLTIVGEAMGTRPRPWLVPGPPATRWPHAADRGRQHDQPAHPDGSGRRLGHERTRRVVGRRGARLVSDGGNVRRGGA